MVTGAIPWIPQPEGAEGASSKIFTTNAFPPCYTERPVPSQSEMELATSGVRASSHSVSYMEIQEPAGNTAEGGGGKEGVQGC